MLTNSKASVQMVGDRYAEMVNSMRPDIAGVKHNISIDNKLDKMASFEEMLSSTKNESVSFEAKVEDSVLHVHSGIDDAAVIGLSDHEWGEKVVAVIVPKAGSSPTEEDIGTMSLVIGPCHAIRRHRR